MFDILSKKMETLPALLFENFAEDVAKIKSIFPKKTVIEPHDKYYAQVQLLKEAIEPKSDFMEKILFLAYSKNRLSTFESALKLYPKLMKFHYDFKGEGG